MAAIYCVSPNRQLHRRIGNKAGYYHITTVYLRAKVGRVSATIKRPVPRLAADGFLFAFPGRCGLKSQNVRRADRQSI